MDAEIQRQAITKIADIVSHLVRKSYNWIAKQKDDEFSDLFGIGWGEVKESGWKGQFAGFCAVRVLEAEEAFPDMGKLETLTMRLATEVMGYAPDSKEDLETRISRAKAELEDLTREIDAKYKRRGQVFQHMISLGQQLEALEISDSAN